MGLLDSLLQELDNGGREKYWSRAPDITRLRNLSLSSLRGCQLHRNQGGDQLWIKELPRGGGWESVAIQNIFEYSRDRGDLCFHRPLRDPDDSADNLSLPVRVCPS